MRMPDRYTFVVASYANRLTPPIKQTGLVLDMSACGCSATVVVDGFVDRMGSNIELSELGGNAMDQYLLERHLLASTTSSSTAKPTLESIRISRESANSEDFKLPDGTLLNIPDLLFDPSPCKKPVQFTALHELVFCATKQSTAESRRAQLGNVVLCGGFSKTPAIVQRLVDELSAMSHHLDQPRVICGECLVGGRDV